MVLFVVIPISGWAQTKNGQITRDDAILLLKRPGSYF
ncbi:MAG: hypothetical protein BWX84_00254 [Verrucomicrobia bacterium ADurb.Bin118]|nr:MAG: hypothetical protein BWX84_00254 [Verrucomicrobia bacterium ADurb.Bin118]